MWVLAEFEATSLFTLKPAAATASGGRTLLVPTPYAVKMALLDVACLLEGRDTAADHWDNWLGGRRVALRPPAQIIVNNTFIKVLKPRRNPAPPGSQDAGYFGRTITYREYAYCDGPLGIAVQVENETHAAHLARWLVNINYLGKRGSFMQITDLPTIHADLPPDYLAIDGQMDGMRLDSILTQLDDVGTGVDFDTVSIYSGKRITLGKQRVLHHIALPYRLIGSSRSYSQYERIDS